jgi:hypothetical protein
MAALTNEARPAGEIPVLKGYKIHEEQIRNVAKNFKELYQARRPDPMPAGYAGKGTIKKTDGKTGSALQLRVQKTIWETSPVENLTRERTNDLLPKMENPGRAVMAIRCDRCGIDFPVADFLYTKKSGLCIDCWEEMVI